MNTINNDLLNLIKKFEGCRLTAYKDVIGVPTIGVGATFYENGSKVKIGDTLTQEGADQLLANTLKIFANGVTNLVKSNININQWNALVSFSFNCGLANFKSSTLLKKVNINPNDETITSEFMKWNKASGKVIAGLTTRREAEAKLYFS